MRKLILAAPLLLLAVKPASAQTPVSDAALIAQAARTNALLSQIAATQNLQLLSSNQQLVVLNVIQGLLQAQVSAQTANAALTFAQQQSGAQGQVQAQQASTASASAGASPQN